MRPDPDSTVSVVVPAYNGMPYLPEALASAVGQTHRPAQVIVVDDGSTDDTAACARRFAADHLEVNVELIRQANQGESAARNRGIAEARGAWVAQLDADDWWEPHKLSSQLDAARRDGSACVLVHTGQHTHYPDGRIDASGLEAAGARVGWCTAQLVEPVAIAHSSILVRRDALQRVGGYDASLAHAVDIDVYFKLSAVGTFAFVPEHLIHYRLHDGQTSWHHKVDQVRHYHEVVWRFFDAHPDLAEQVGRERIDGGLARLVRLKLESLYWNRRLPAYRALLRFALDRYPDDPALRPWIRRARLPDWLIRGKDRLARVARRPGRGAPRGAPRP